MQHTTIALAALAAVVICVPHSRGANPPAPDLRFNPALGAIRASGQWKQTTFILLDEDGKGVVVPALTDLSYGSDANSTSPPDYGPKGFWKEVSPGKYTLIASAPGKRAARVSFEVGMGQEIWLRAKLDEEQSKVDVSEPLAEKVGPTWHKAVLAKISVRWRQQ